MVVRGAEPREVRAGMTRLTTVGRKGMKCLLQNISRQNRKFSKAGNEGKIGGGAKGTGTMQRQTLLADLSH